MVAVTESDHGQTRGARPWSALRSLTMVRMTFPTMVDATNSSVPGPASCHEGSHMPLCEVSHTFCVWRVLIYLDGVLDFWVGRSDVIFTGIFQERENTQIHLKPSKNVHTPYSNRPTLSGRAGAQEGRSWLPGSAPQPRAAGEGRSEGG